MLHTNQFAVAYAEKRARILHIAVLVVWFVGFWQTQASAWVQSWAQASDVVCLATVTDRRISPLQSAERKGFSQDVEFKLTLERAVKGEIPTLIILNAQQFDRDALVKAYPGGIGFSGPIPYGELEVGHRYLFFLRRIKPDQFILMNGFSGSQSVVETNADLPKAVVDNVPLLQILRVLLSTIRSPNEKDRLRVITLLSDFRNYACDNFISYQRDSLRLLRESQGYEAVRQALQAEAIPLLLELSNSPNIELSSAALGAAAHLQSVAVIPKLVRLVGGEVDSPTKAPAEQALRGFCTITAGPSLVKLLDLNHKVEVRRAAAMALQTVQDKRTVPVMIDILQTDPDLEVRFWASNALGETLFREKFDVLQGTTKEGFRLEQRKYQAYWLNWANQRQELLKKWREQLSVAPDIDQNPVAP